jgi:hypothetical protein
MQLIERVRAIVAAARTAGMPWWDSRAQFARLIAEADTAGLFDCSDDRTDELMAQLGESLGIGPEHIGQLVDRAHAEHDTRLRQIAARRAMPRWRRVLTYRASSGYRIVTALALVWTAFNLAAITMPTAMHATACVAEDSSRAHIPTGPLGCIWWGGLQGNGHGATVWNTPGRAR